MLRGITLDWDPLPFTQGKITAIDTAAGTISLAVDPGFSIDPALFAKGCAGLIYEEKSRELKRKAWDLFGLQITPAGDNAVSLKCKDANLLKNSGAVVGDLMAIRALSGEMGIRLVNCANITLTDVTIFTAPGMGIQELGGEGGNKYTITITRGPKYQGIDRLLSSPADALHSSGVRVGPAITNCRLEYQGDDGVAIHGAYALVAGSTDANTLIVSPKNEMALHAGDRFRLYDGKEFVLKSEANVVSVTKLPSPGEEILKPMASIWKAYRGEAPKMKYYEVKLDKPVKTAAGDLVSSPDWLGSGFLVQNCQIGHHRARAINIKASNGVIENNHIEAVSSAGIALGPEFAYWLEGDYVRDIVIRNNQIRETGLGAAILKHDKAILVGAITIYALTPDHELPGGTDNANLTIEHNTIDSVGGIGMVIACAKNVSVQSNTVSNTQFLGPLGGGKEFGIDPEAAIYLDQTADVRLEKNTLSGKGVVSGKAVKP